jgi:hypothetical protein
MPDNALNIGRTACGFGCEQFFVHVFPLFTKLEHLPKLNAAQLSLPSPCPSGGAPLIPALHAWPNLALHDPLSQVVAGFATVILEPSELVLDGIELHRIGTVAVACRAKPFSVFHVKPPVN